MRKTIIVNDNAGGHGKTQSIKAIYEEFLKCYPSMTPKNPIEDGSKNESWDTKAIFTIEVNGELVKIGLESQGDPKSRQLESLTDFVKDNCDIIIGASRTRGETVHNVWDISKKYEYRIIWARNYICYDDMTHKALKALYVDNIMKMVEEIIHNRL